MPSVSIGLARNESSPGHVTCNLSIEVREGSCFDLCPKYAARSGRDALAQDYVIDNIFILGFGRAL